MRDVGSAALAALASAMLVLASGPARAAEEPPAEPVLKLASPGRPPLKALRYRVQPGQRGAVTLSMTTAIAMSVGGQELPAAPAPETRCRFDYHVTGITPAGDIRYEFEIGGFEAVARPDVPAAVLEATRGALAAVKGLRGHIVVTTRGITREADIEMPSDAPPPLRAMADSLRQSARQFSAPLPEEAVGAGARWDTTYRMTMNGVTLEQTGRQELTEIDGDRGRLTIAITQTAPPQPIQDPSLPPGTRVNLVSMSSTGTAESVFELTRLTPVSANVKLKMRMKSRIEMPEQKPQDMDARADMSMSISSR